MEDITGLLNKVENKGATPEGKLSADEFNKLVRAVIDNQSSVRTVSYNNGTKIKPDDEGNVNLIITESNYVLRLKTTVDGTAPYKVALGSEYNMTVEVSNKYVDGEEQIPVSTACKATFYCNGVVVSTQDVYDGDKIVFNFGKFFIEGKNTIYVSVDNNYGEVQNTLTYEVSAIYLSVELPNFLKTEIKRGAWELDVKIIGSDANVYIVIDGNGGLAGYQTAGSTIAYPIEYGTSTGAHKLSVYATSAEDSSVQTEPIVSEFIYIAEGSEKTVIATSLQDYTAMQMYNVLSVPYWVYKPNYEGTIAVKLAIINDLDEELTSTTQSVEVTNSTTGLRQWDISLFDDTLIGDRRVRIEADGEIRDIPIQINASDVKLAEIGGYDVYLSSAGRSNSDENVREWSYGDYQVTFPDDLEFSELASGWNYDDDGNVALHLKRGREITLNYYPFRENPSYGNDEDVIGNKRGMTFSIELATRNCVKRDGSVVRCVHEGRGFEFLANSMTFASNSESLSADYKEDTRVRIDLVIEGQPTTYTYDDNGVTKTSEESRMIVYIDGVYQQMLLTSSVSDFRQDVPQPITIGSDYCDIDIYCIRAYRTSLNMKGITDNYAYDTPKVEDKIAIAKRCDVFDSSLNVSYPKIVNARPHLPIMLLGIETLPNSKTKIPIATTSYDNPLNKDNYDAGNPSWTSANDEIGNQGTSSMNYPMPYRNFDWKTLSKAFMIGGQIYPKIPLYAGMPPIGKLTFKKDYASSEMANNIICSEMFNQMAVGLKDTFPNCLTPAQFNIDANKYRLALKGIPFFIFQYWDSKYTPLGMFNLIPNKNEHEYLGFVPPYTWEQSRAQSWEIRDNNIFWDFYLDESAWDAEEGKLIKNCPFTYYEAIYPKDSANKSGDENLDFGDASTEAQVEVSKNETKDILRLHNWFVSTNQKLATGKLLDEPYTDASGREYAYDTAAYRLAKFVTEQSDYLVLHQWVLYYIWREQFWMFDSGSKNLQIHTYDGVHWGCHVRDADTGLGSDNEGQFKFPPYLEDTDYRRSGEFIFNQKVQPEGSDTVLNGQLGAVWINIRDGFGDLVQQMYTTLYDNAAITKFNYDKTIEWFESHQGAWSEALYNFGSHQYYGGAPYSKWISSGLGDKKNQRRFWLYYGFRYRASKYHAGSASNRITWRQFGTGSDLQMKTYSQMYVSLGFGAYDYKTTRRYRCLDLENGVTVKNEFTTNVNDVVMYLFNGDMITDIGNLYQFGNIGSLDLTNAKRLRWLRVGNKDAQEQYVNTKLTALVTTACTALEYLDLTSCKGFGTGTGQNGIYTLDLSKQTLLQECYCKGATMSGITFPETPSLKTIHLGGDLVRLRLVNLIGLEDFSIEGVSKLQSIIMRNSADVSKTKSYLIVGNILLDESNVLTDVELDGIEWMDADIAIVEKLVNINARLKGHIKILGANKVSYALKMKMLELYGNIDDENNSLYVEYEKTSLTWVEMKPKVYLSEVGEHKLDYKVNSEFANNFTSVKWSLEENLYATIDENTGIVNVTRVGEEDANDTGPNAKVTVTITLLDGSTVSDTSNLNFWERAAKLGDIVYHDGWVASPDDHEENVGAGREAIGVCFYINPENKTERLMVSVLGARSTDYTWGVNPTSNPDFELADDPSYNAYDIPTLPNYSTYLNNPTLAVVNGLRGGTEVDAEGWTVYNPNSHPYGLIGFITLQRNILDYREGDRIPYGLYHTLLIIEARNKVLSDSAVNMPIPAPNAKQTELENFIALRADAVANSGNAGGAVYFGPASYCYAYQPTERTDLLDKFKPHRWFLPSVGEVMRICFHWQQGYTAADIGKEFAIFAKPIQLGLLYNDNAGWANNSSMALGHTSTEHATVGQDYLLVSNQWRSDYGKKRGCHGTPICAF